MLARLKQNVWFGGRIFKTAVAVLLTASICHLLGWPPMFAVITAIVTIEPTARDSIKKAFERFPASAIGAAYSVIFTFMLGDSSFAYAFVAFFTIYTCYKLKLHAGTLVATLTGVAMISTIHDEYVSSFFVRLGTTTLGLTISSLVNLWVIRPDYSRDIAEKTRQLLADLNEYLQRRGSEILQNQPLHSETDQQLQSALKKLDKVETLCSYQRKDSPFTAFAKFAADASAFESVVVAALAQALIMIVRACDRCIMIRGRLPSCAGCLIICATFMSFDCRNSTWIVRPLKRSAL